MFRASVARVLAAVGLVGQARYPAVHPVETQPVKRTKGEKGQKRAVRPKPSGAAALKRAAKKRKNKQK